MARTAKAASLGSPGETDETENPPGGPSLLDLQRAAALALLVFAVSFLTYSRTLPPNADEMMNYALTESLAKLGRLDVDQVSTVGANPEEYGVGGHRYSKYGPAQAVLAVPLYWLAQRLPIGAVDAVLLENHVLTALTIGLLYLLARRLGYGPGVSLTVSLIACFTTPVWVHAKRFFGEPTTALLLLLTVYFVVAARQGGRRRHLALAGLAAGGFVAAKYVNVVFLAPLLFYAAWPDRPAASRRGPSDGSLPAVRSAAYRLAWLADGGLPVAVALGLYNWARFGSPLESGYARWEQFNTPLWEGVGGFLFSPGKSVFVYAPVLLLLFFWTRAFWRRHRGLTVALLAVFVLHLGVYGTWWVWWGAWAWGPRFLVPLMPLTALLLAAGLDQAVAKRSALGLAAFGLLTLLGLGVQVLGVAVDHTVYMAHLLPLNPRPDTLTLYDLGRSPVLAQLQFLTRRWLDFAWVLRDGPSALYLQPLLAGAAGAVAGLIGLVGLWRARPGPASALALLVVAAVAASSALFALNRYYRTDEQYMKGLAARIAAAEQPSGVIHLAPTHVVPYSNGVKSGPPTVGWSEEPEPLNPRLARLLEPLVAGGRELWLVTQYPKGAPPNGVEAWVGRRAYKVEEVAAGPLRAARYRVDAGDLALTPVAARFGGGVELVGYAVLPGSLRPGGLFQVTLVWRTAARLDRDYSVFAHLVDGSGKLQAQGDGPPGDGYRPTSVWPVGELIADHRIVAVPAGASGQGHTLHVGLYLLANGERLPIVDADGRRVDDKVALKLD